MSGNSVAAIENDEANRLIRRGMARTGANLHVNPLNLLMLRWTPLRFSCGALRLPSTTERRLMQSILEGQPYFR